MQFVLEQKGCGRAAALLPGWATDGRIFDGLELDFDLIWPPRAGPAGLADALAGFLNRRGLEPPTIIGWSLGGFVAVEFARRYPRLAGRLVLVGVRERYPPPQIEMMRRALREDRQGCLRDFYRQCFLPAQRADFGRFRAGLMPRYLQELGEQELLNGLDYLAGAEICPEMLPAARVTLVHGAHDGVAPLEDARSLARRARCDAFHVLEDAGHAAFLAKDFARIVEND